MLGNVSDETGPKQRENPDKTYVWRERSWCRPRKQRKRRSSRKQRRRRPVWRERSLSFSRSPNNDEGETAPPPAEDKILPGEEVFPSPEQGAELIPSPQAPTSHRSPMDVSSMVCQLCGGIQLRGAALEELEEEVDRMLEECSLHEDAQQEPILRRMAWSQIWPGNPFWQ